MYDSSFNGDHGDIIHIFISQILLLKEYFSPTAFACKLYYIEYSM